MIRDQGRSTQVSSSSQILTSIFDKYVPERMGEDVLDGLCFHPPWTTTDVCFDLPVTASSRTFFAECESSKTPRWSQLIRAERSSNGSWRSHRALAGSSRTRAHGDASFKSNGELAVLPLRMAIQNFIDFHHVGRFRRASFFHAFPLIFGFPILLFMTYFLYYGVCYGGTQLFLATAYATVVRSYSWELFGCRISHVFVSTNFFCRLAGFRGGQMCFPGRDCVPLHCLLSQGCS